MFGTGDDLVGPSSSSHYDAEGDMKLKRLEKQIFEAKTLIESATQVLRQKGILKKDMVQHLNGQICKEDSIYTRHGGPTGDSTDSNQACLQKCIANPECGFAAAWPDRGCRHWAAKCTTEPSTNSPVLYKRREENLADLLSNDISRKESSYPLSHLPMPAVAGGGKAPSPDPPGLLLKPVDPSKKGLIPIVVICFNRANFLRRTLTSLSTNIAKMSGGRADNFPIYISRQGDHPGVGQVIEEFASMIHGINRYNFIDNGARKKGFEGSQWLSYYKISQHYQSALKWLFQTQGMPRALVLEDDLEIAVDFFEYFSSLAPIYDEDPTVFCVSAWNDNGMTKVVKDNRNILRTDVFPGLGWMINRRIWDELSVKWPLAFWDDWMREKEQPRGRSCIMPEVNRVYTFGDRGNSVDNTFWRLYLAPIRLNDEEVDFANIDISYIKMPNYQRHIADQVRAATKISVNEIQSSQASVRVVTYSNQMEFRSAANVLGIQPDFKNGNPRASFGHINLAYASGRKTFIVDTQAYSKIQRQEENWPYLWAGSDVVRSQ